jgi:hypothetical protein
VNNERFLSEALPRVRGDARCSGETCSWDWLVILAEFEDFTTLQFILTNARWAGAPTQKQMLKKYLRERMRAAVRRLPHSEDVLAEVLEKSSRKWRAVNERV